MKALKLVFSREFPNHLLIYVKNREGDFSTDIGSKALRYAIDFEFNETSAFVFGHCHKGFTGDRAYEEKNANSGKMQSFYNVSIVSDDMALTFNNQKFDEFTTFTIGNY